jgi:glycosyltransferase involved in cell wall biosynthesis
MDSCVLLNWQEIDVSKDSVRRLLKEPDLEVIVVDNGSTDGSKEYFRTLDIKFVDLDKNYGASVGRNSGIKVATGKNIFLIDGDCLYVPGTIKEYEKILDKNKDAYCIGQNSFELLTRLMQNGTPDPIDADMRMGTDYTVTQGFPMAWTNYGLFRGELLRKVKFIEEGAFGEPGYGLEDSDLHKEMEKLGFISLACSLPTYYHAAHGGLRELDRDNSDYKFKERTKIFEKKWGKKNDWADILAKGVEMVSR